jgi:alanine racemase
MFHTSWIELSKRALNNNLHYLKQRVGPQVTFSMVVKANAYGHGIEELLPLIEEAGVEHFSVFSVAEAQRVQRIKRARCSLMIMGFVDDDQLEWAIENDVSFFVFTPERLAATRATAQRVGKPARIHVELETGMHRTGFCEDQLGEVVRGLDGAGHRLRLEGLCTHLAGAESLANHERVLAQIREYERLCRALRDQGLVPRFRHVACSAGVFNYPETIYDLVRVGIAAYGFWPNDESRVRHLLSLGENGELAEDPLHRVLSWKSTIMSVNRVPEGRYVSYGNAYKTNRPSLIATVPVGYGYGYSRTLSNNGHLLVRGKRVPVVGTVNMNMAVIDVTDVQGVAVGDEVVLIGTQGDALITVASFADMNNALNYELLTRLPDHIPRIPVM